MTVIKINAITVPADSGDTLAQRFAARAGAVDGQAGFEGFELLPAEPLAAAGYFGWQKWKLLVILRFSR